MADLRDSVVLASGGVATANAPPLDSAKCLEGLALPTSHLAHWGKMRPFVTNRSHDLLQVLENQILSEAPFPPLKSGGPIEAMRAM